MEQPSSGAHSTLLQQSLDDDTSNQSRRSIPFPSHLTTILSNTIERPIYLSLMNLLKSYETVKPRPR